MTVDPNTTLLDALAQSAKEQAALKDWAQVTLADVCAGCDATLADCARAKISKADIAAHIDLGLDTQMLACADDLDPTQSVRDRLFDVVMARFDAMEAQRAMWASILEGDASDPFARLARRARRLSTAAWALEAAGVAASSLSGGARAIGVARIVRTCEAVWLKDGPDLAKTMAHLDQELRKGETWVERGATLSAFLKRGNAKSKPEAEHSL
jgi:ubiquinone biosynthesis protein COQ9